MCIFMSLLYEVMKIKTIFHLLLLFLILTIGSCASSGPGKTPASVEEAEKMLAKQDKERTKQAKKEQKEAYKRFWAMQSKDARKSIKQNKRRNKRLARMKKKKVRQS